MPNRRLRKACEVIARNLERQLRRTGMTAFELNREAGLGSSHVARILRGETRPDIVTLTLLAYHLGTTVEELAPMDEVMAAIESERAERRTARRKRRR